MAATWIVGALTVHIGVWVAVVGMLAILGWLLMTGHFKTAGICGWILGAAMLMQDAFILAACLAIVLFLLLISTRAAGTAWAFAALFGLTFLGAWQDNEDSPEPQGQLQQLTAVQKAHTNLNELQERRNAVQALLDKTREEQEDVVLRMRQMGIKTTSDLKDHPRGRVLVEEFQRLLAEVKSLESAVVRIEGGVAKAKALIRQIERNEVLGQAGMSEDELKELSEQLMLAEETEAGELPSVPVDPAQTDALLEQTLARP